ncbi:spoIIIJ-associated protein [Bryocella elongata]|uniref:SpoIIIJ-associated protein n=1 Tax=Bryocella elongata TaxID=863522 RepID=A0A1H5Y3F6_9BACT|nr:R3H domain-containing nucleic acid-binding protein [Bryocella elongata]SEG18428.1 spoIIIJ-associated protein [Bryocella elongata]
MEDLAQAAEQIASFMRTLTTVGGLRLKYRITAGAGAADPDEIERRDIYVECKGADAELLLENDGELLRSLEHIAAKILRLEPEDHDRVSFDTNGYKASRAQNLRDAADRAIDYVDDNDKPFRFPAMNSRERRILHLFLKESGLQTASAGEGPERAVVLYPEGYKIPVERPSFGDRRGGGFNRGGGGGRGGGRGRY